ncbi:hypothetical protein JZ751_030011, partial [Albula glossodonta]
MTAAIHLNLPPLRPLPPPGLALMPNCEDHMRSLLITTPPASLPAPLRLDFTVGQIDSLEQWIQWDGVIQWDRGRCLTSEGLG